MACGSFAEAPLDVQRDIVGHFAAGEAARAELGAAERQPRLVRRHALVLSAFYSHPWAWNEIGFGGPAYPRGYAAFGSPGLGEEAEAWEGREAIHRDPVREARA